MTEAIGLDNLTTNLTSNCSVLSEYDMVKHAKMAVPIIFGLILVFGVVGNGSVVLIVVKSKQMRTIPNIYIVSLALGDLVLILIAVPFSAFVFTFREWYFGPILCKLNVVLETFSLGVSVFTLTLLSVDRYLAITHPMRTRSKSSVKKAVWRASCVWILSSCLAIPDVICSGLKFSPVLCLTYCDPYKAEWGNWYVKFNVTFRFVVYFAIPLFIIGACYCLMARNLVYGNSNEPVEATLKLQRQNKTKSSRTQVAILVLSFVVVFVICWLPRHIFLIGHLYDLFNFNGFWFVFKIAGFCLAFMNSCVNPLALYLQSKQFRKCFRGYFCKCTCWQLQTSSNNKSLSPKSQT